MGWVELPDRPPERGGKMRATMVLDPDELLATVDLLKGALAEFTAGMANGLPGAALDRSRQAPAGPSSAARPALPQQPAPQPGPQPLPAAAAQPNVRPQPQAQFRPPQPQPQAQFRPPQPQPQAQQQPQASIQQSMAQMRLQPQPQPTHRHAPAAQAPQQQQRPQPAPFSQQQQQQFRGPQPAPAAPRPQQPQQQVFGTTVPAAAAAGAAPAAASSRWHMCFASDAGEHGNGTVSALAYMQSLPGLPGGDGHAGWLVSGSKGILNLWETNRAAVGDEMALMCMHSQAVDVIPSKLVLEPETKLMFGAAMGTSDAAECVSVHSLDPEVGLLAYRYKFAPPPDRPRAPQRLMQQVVSVHGMTPGLRGSIIASYGERLLMFEARANTRINSVLHEAAFHFVAHPGSIVTCLQRSTLEGSCSLFSGAQNGHIHMWDLKSPPKSNQPAATLLRHTKSVTGLTLVSSDTLASSSMDGSVLLWDLRSTGFPVQSCQAPNNAGVLKIAAGPWGDLLAVSTTQGLHCLELFDFSAPMSSISSSAAPARPYSNIAFNTVTHDLYAGSGSGSVHVYSRLT